MHLLYCLFFKKANDIHIRNIRTYPHAKLDPCMPTHLHTYIHTYCTFVPRHLPDLISGDHVYGQRVLQLPGAVSGTPFGRRLCPRWRPKIFLLPPNRRYRKSLYRFEVNVAKQNHFWARSLRKQPARRRKAKAMLGKLGVLWYMCVHTDNMLRSRIQLR